VILLFLIKPKKRYRYIMNYINSNYLKIPLLMGFTIFLIAFVPIQQKEEWKAPKEADALKNPLKESTEASLAGQKLYNNMCAICHGNKGKGDGMGGMSLKPRPTNITTAKTQLQTDGAIYWKITEGRAPMASYKTILSEEQRWQLVNYIRKLKK
jgi:mono/diheme cytochrome c family protein